MNYLTSAAGVAGVAGVVGSAGLFSSDMVRISFQELMRFDLQPCPGRMP